MLNEDLNNRWTDDGSGTTFTFGSAAADRNDRRRWQYDVQATLFKDNWLGGNHSIKFGSVSERESQEFRDEGFLDEISLAFRSPSPLPNFTTPYRVTIRNTPRQTTNANWHHGAYINDSIQVNRVTLSLGVRWDYYNLLPRTGDPGEPLPRLLLRRRASPDLGRSLLVDANSVC